MVVEKGKPATLRCDVTGATQDPQVMKFTVDGGDITQEESLGNFQNGEKVRGLMLSTLQDIYMRL